MAALDIVVEVDSLVDIQVTVETLTRIDVEVDSLVDIQVTVDYV